MHVLCLQQLWQTLYLYTTHIIFVIQVDEYIYSLTHLIKRMSSLLVLINVRFANLEHVVRCVQCPPHHLLAFLYVIKFI